MEKKITEILHSIDNGEAAISWFSSIIQPYSITEESPE